MNASKSAHVNLINGLTTIPPFAFAKSVNKEKMLQKFKNTKDS